MEDIRIYLKYIIFLSSFLLIIEAKAAYLSMVSGNVMLGSQLSVNTFSGSGTIGGFAGGNYSYQLTRYGNFTSNNLVINIGGVAWSPGATRFITSNNQSFGISGWIPYGVECGHQENIKMDIYSYNGQQVLSYTFIVINPIQPIPFSQFSIYESTLTANTIIKGCGNSSPNILANNINVKYTGTGVVKSYRILIRQATSQGLPVVGGYQFTQTIQNSTVPLFINLKNIVSTGSVIGLIPSLWTYYLITLETSGGPCSGGVSTHTALVLLNPGCCFK